MAWKKGGRGGAAGEGGGWGRRNHGWKVGGVAVDTGTMTREGDSRSHVIAGDGPHVIAGGCAAGGDRLPGTRRCHRDCQRGGEGLSSRAMTLPRAAGTRWTLEDLVDFEHALAETREDGPRIPDSLRHQVREATRDLPPAVARRVGLHLWLDHQRAGNKEDQGAGGGAGLAGRRFSRALRLVAGILMVVALMAGISAVLGMLDRSRGGIHAVWFLAVVLGLQFLLLAAAFAAFVFRRRVGDGFGLLQSLAGSLVRQVAGSRRPVWWERATATASSLRPALLWPLARLTQEAAVFFNLGLLAGLAGLVVFQHVGFFWESTTQVALQHSLEPVVGFLSAPWRSFLPDCVPDLPATRWWPGEPSAFRAHAHGWWTFLLLAIAFWGLLPRLVLLAIASHLARRALARLEFRERHHRALWRDLTEIGRDDPCQGPADGALVLDLGGSGIVPDMLRPFLLRRLRVHPTAWHPIAVLDPEREAEAGAALARSPAGVVVLAEGWALSPARVRDLHAQVRRAAGPDAPLVFLIVNSGPDRAPLPPTPEERIEWERFTDSLADPATEAVAYGPL